MTTAERSKAQVSELVDRINEAFAAGRWRDVEACVADDIVMVFPGFAGRSEGKQAFLAGFRDMAENARVLDFEESERQVDVFGDTAVASFAFGILYEREGQSYRGSGRDLWVFARRSDGWRAVWRTLVEMKEEAVESE